MQDVIDTGFQFTINDFATGDPSPVVIDLDQCDLLTLRIGSDIIQITRTSGEWRAHTINGAGSAAQVKSI